MNKHTPGPWHFDDEMLRAAGYQDIAEVFSARVADSSATTHPRASIARS
jgi:hypothetical protein